MSPSSNSEGSYPRWPFWKTKSSGSVPTKKLNLWRQVGEETERQRDRERETETERDRETEREKQRQRETETERDRENQIIKEV